MNGNILCALCIFDGRKEDEEDVLHMGINAKIVEIDSDKQIIYISETAGNNTKYLVEGAPLIAIE